jgi:hypothetical protein
MMSAGADFLESDLLDTIVEDDAAVEVDTEEVALKSLYLYQS